MLQSSKGRGLILVRENRRVLDDSILDESLVVLIADSDCKRELVCILTRGRVLVGTGSRIPFQDLTDCSTGEKIADVRVTIAGIQCDGDGGIDIGRQNIAAGTGGRRS